MKSNKQNKIEKKTVAVSRGFDGKIIIRVATNEKGGPMWGTIESELNLGEAYVGVLRRHDIA